MGGVASAVKNCVSGVFHAVADAFVYVAKKGFEFLNCIWDGIQDLWNRRKWQDNNFIAGFEKGRLLYKEDMTRHSTDPYLIKFVAKKNEIITGLSSVRLEKEMDTPEATVLEGGFNFSYVDLQLKNRYNRKWGCHVEIWGDDAQPGRTFG